MPILKIIKAFYIRNFIFGVEDSLVSTVGLLSGVAVTDLSANAIIITGVVLIFVEAFSMAVGSLLSEQSANEYANRSETSMKMPIRGGIVMFFSYFVSGFIPLSPYIFLPVKFAFPWSIILSLLALFLLGFLSGKISNTKPFKNAFRMAIIGGIAIFAGVLVGTLTQGIL